MGITINNLKAFNNLINIDHGDNIVFFKFGTDWCIPCIEIDKILINIPNSLIYYISVDNENFESYLMENKIYTIPYIIIKYGNKIKKINGIHTINQIEKYIEELKM
jgi:thiol-disulfide isomerase/thioredoxin